MPFTPASRTLHEGFIFGACKCPTLRRRHNPRGAEVAHSLWSKALALALVALALVVALDRISALVAEREGRLREAEAGVAASLATQQELIGPVLQRRCEETWTVELVDGKERKPVMQRREFDLVATPKTLGLDGTATIEARRRGLYKVNGYVLKATLIASWASLQGLQPRAEQPRSVLSCGEPVLFVGVGDARGLRSVTVTQRSGIALPVLAGTPRDKMPKGFQVALTPQQWADGAFSADIELELVGTRRLAIAPVAEQTQVRLRSDWPHPSFHGRFLPNEREVGDNGFSATWRISALATSAPHDVRSQRPQVENFAVDFIDPINAYSLADRATKYGVLFIGLTFLGVALTEVMRRARVHPVQYLLVGSALAIFFLLLVSLSEHMAFVWAYASAAAACTGLLAFYGTHVLGGWRAGLAFGAAVAALYGVLYQLLQQEQTALVLGSGLLFVVLAAVMVLTRRFDWYRLVEQWRGAKPGGEGA
jgi:inner membrane protein